MVSSPSLRILAAPLLIAGLLLALALVSNNGGGGVVEALQKVTGTQGATKATPAAQKVSLKAVSPAQKQAELQEEEKVHVMKCAKQITGDDTPRKLAPAVRDKVLACAALFMPPVHTKQLLAAAAAKLAASAKSAAEKADAKSLVKATTGEDGETKTTTTSTAQQPAEKTAKLTQRAHAQAAHSTVSVKRAATAHTDSAAASAKK